MSKNITNENNKSLLEMFIVIIFVVSVIGWGFKIYKITQSVHPPQWGACSLADMSKEEKENCLKEKELKEQRAVEAEKFLSENKSTFMFAGIICLLGTIIIIAKSKKLKLNGTYVLFEVLSIILSVLLIL